MSTLTIQLDDESVRLVHQAARISAQPLESWLRAQVCLAAISTVDGANSVVSRVSPLHPGAMQPALNFNAPSEEFTTYF